MLFDGVNEIKSVQALAPAAARNTDTATSAVNRQTATPAAAVIAGLGFNSITFEFNIGNAGDTWSASNRIALKLQESDDSTDGIDGTWTDVTTDTGLIYDSINVTLTSSKEIRLISSTADDLQAYRLGYRGDAKWVRGMVDFEGTHSTGTILGASCQLGMPNHSPVENAGN